MKKAGPLRLTWPDIDHVGYVRQAFEGASLTIFINILESGLLKKCMRFDEDKARISS
ncbi:unnamed protein product [Dovyalis caffra]|uniref:Uncharacterized protein n=1 Tax=Dovyalis caffra TaxID=77055 RepID=A0AAV1RWR4_9ROSI|nr:unnamed protein product [Dovyalis caffra]